MRHELVVQHWTVSGNELRLNYQVGEHHFCEILTFPSDIARSPTVDRVIDLLAVSAGVSYAKAFVPVRLDLSGFPLTRASTLMVSALYDDGLREFAVTNNLHIPVDVDIVFAHADDDPPPPVSSERRPLLPLGGGKDSCVVLGALRHRNPVLVSVGNNPYTAQVARAAGLPLHVVGRTIDPHLLELNSLGAPNGHVPVTAINSLIAVLLAEMTQCTDVVMANESSSSEPTRVVDGLAVNHQYSKSFAFENLLRSALASIGSSVNYFSALRNRTDDEISRAFAGTGPALHGAFMSCNRAMVRDPQRRSNGWCTRCPKCRTVFLSLAPHMTPGQLANIFRSDLLNDSAQIDGFRELITPGDKPFECVSDLAHASSTMIALSENPLWCDHVVVRALQSCPVVADTWDASTDSSDANIPADYREDLERAFRG